MGRRNSLLFTNLSQYTRGFEFRVLSWVRYERFLRQKLEKLGKILRGPF